MTSDHPGPPFKTSDAGPFVESSAGPASAPSSMKGFFLLLAILAVVATLAFFLLGDSVDRWLPRK